MVAVNGTTKALTRMSFELSMARQVLESVSWAVFDLEQMPDVSINNYVGDILIYQIT